MSYVKLETDRLFMRQWKKEDFKFLIPHFKNKEFTKYLGGIKNEEATWIMMTNYAGLWKLSGFSYWALEEKTTKKLVGGCGLWKSPAWPDIELGYWILPQFHRKGYAAEAAIRAKQFAFEVLNLPELVSYIDPRNDTSIKIAKKLNAVYDRTIELSSFGPHEVYHYSKN